MGEFDNDSKIPTEPELQSLYGVSRVTIRKAISGLVSEGLLTRQQGLGTFVKHKKLRRKIKYVTGFTENCREYGFEPKTILLDRKIISATEKIAKQLMIDRGDKIIKTVRKRLADSTPIMLENNYYPLEKYPFILDEDLTGSIYSLLAKKYNVYPENPGETILEITASDEYLSKIMNVPLGTPFFYMDTEISDQNYRPIHVGHQYYLADYYKFSI